MKSASNDLFEDESVYQIKSTEFKFYGIEQDSVWKVVFVHASDDLNSEKEKEMSQKMLKALDIREEDVLFISRDENQYISIAELVKCCEFQIVVLFGVEPGNVGLSVDYKLYLPFHLLGKQIAVANSFSDLMKDNQKKKALWECLQKMFK